ncbi:MAG: ABC transporter substrate-binding protein [Verrucomicrobiota bacterium]
MRALLLWLATCLALSAGEHRIASYSPGATQTLLDLGCSAEIVMATRWCPLPKDHPAAKDADIFLPDLERLLGAKPDLVILPRMANPLWAEKCAKAGLRTVVLSPESGSAVGKDILVLGEATGRIAQAQQLADELSMRPTKTPRTIIIIWDGVMAGPDSYLAEPLAAAGLKSALTRGSWIKFDWEIIATAKPDAVLWIQDSRTDSAIVTGLGKVIEMGRIPGVRDLLCLKNKRVYQARSGSNWLPGSGLTKIKGDLIGVRKEIE